LNERIRRARRKRFQLVFSILLVAALGCSIEGALTEAARLVGVYDAILRARFDQARQQISAACPTAPPEACLALRGALLWWQILIDPDSRALDAELEGAARTAIARADQWTRREPMRAEAWFYLAGSYAPLVQLRGLRGERVAAARDGNRIRAALEHATALDSQLYDAYFGIGLYHYYADVLPAAAKLLRFLLLLPGGDRAQGLREMQQAREHGVLLSGEADFQMHYLYLWYEKQPLRAIELLRGLDARYPSNPVFLRRIAEIEHDEIHDHRASADAWAVLLARARAGDVEAARTAETRAHIGLARESLDLSDSQRAADHARAAIAAQPSPPYSSLALAQFYLGLAFDQMGRADLAKEAYVAAIAASPPDDPFDVRTHARDRLRESVHSRDPRR
jgi:tetratricopeptide (TPR) repeat protein